MDVLSSRILLRPANLGQSRRFYRDVLGLAIYREFGDPADPDVVFFLGPGLLEVSGRSAAPPGGAVMIWLQVRDVHAEHQRLVAADVRVVREPVTEPWGLIEMWIEDPDGVAIVLVEIPADHPLRRDQRSFSRTTLSTGAVNHHAACAGIAVPRQARIFMQADALLPCRHRGVRHPPDAHCRHDGALDLQPAGTGRRHRDDGR